MAKVMGTDTTLYFVTSSDTADTFDASDVSITSYPCWTTTSPMTATITYPPYIETHSHSVVGETLSMRGLFEVYIVDPQDGNILGPYRVIAKDETAAKMKVVAAHLNAAVVDIDDYDIIVKRLGDVRPKKSVQ